MNVDEAMEWAEEVERLRDELAVEREAVKSLGNSFDKLRAELAAAKAASHCPVKLIDIAIGDDVFNWPGDWSNYRCVALGSQDEAKIFEAWLRERMKERGEQ